MTVCFSVFHADIFLSLHLNSRFLSSSHNWNTLFLGTSAVADAIAEKYNTTKSQVLDHVSDFTSSSPAFTLLSASFPPPFFFFYLNNLLQFLTNYKNIIQEKK